MNSIKTNQIIRSFIIVPLLTTAISMNTFTASVDTALTSAVTAQTVTTPSTQSPEALALQMERESEAKKIDAYFAKNDMPLAGYGMKMVLAAEKNGLEWNLLPAIAVRETSGGKHACKGNLFGFGSCKIAHATFDESIDEVAAHLGGNKPSTASYYKGKSTRGILKTYNSVIPGYTDQVFSIMSRIDSTSI